MLNLINLKIICFRSKLKVTFFFGNKHSIKEKINAKDVCIPDFNPVTYISLMHGIIVRFREEHLVTTANKMASHANFERVVALSWI